MNTQNITAEMQALERLLEKQIKLFQKDRISDVEVLSGQAGIIIEGLKQAKLDRSGDFKQQFERLAKLYKRLVLIAAAKKELTDERLKRIGEGKKTLKAYLKSVRR